MKIEWFGNSTFLISSTNGRKILIDPFNILSFNEYNMPADIITFSKQKEIKNNTSTRKILFQGENYTDDNIKIRGYSSFSDNMNGLKRGSNYIYTYELDGAKLCHLGYLACQLTNEYIKILKNPDILFLPIGGNYCFNGQEAFNTAKALSPKYIIPMCYRCSAKDFYFNGPKEFLSFPNKIMPVNDSKIYLSTLPTSNEVLTLLLNSSDILL